jgi:hypothetical protein
LRNATSSFILTSFSWRTPLQSLVGGIEECNPYRSVKNLLKVYRLQNLLRRIKECNKMYNNGLSSDDAMNKLSDKSPLISRITEIVEPLRKN